MSAHNLLVALTADFYDSNGVSKYRDIGLSVLAEHPHIKQTDICRAPALARHRPKSSPSVFCFR